VVRCFEKDGFQIGGSYDPKANISLQNTHLFGFKSFCGGTPGVDYYFGTRLPKSEKEVELFLQAYANYLRKEGPTFPHVENLIGKSYDLTCNQLSLNHLSL